MSKVIGIDLFCGIGGLTHGLYKAGIEIRAGFDIDESCRKSFSQVANGNPEFIVGDIKQLKDDDFLKYFRDINKETDYTMVAGCAPCQPYSAHQKSKDIDSRSTHKSYGLIKEYLRVVNIINPDFVVMENVRQLAKDPIFLNKFIAYFQNHDYYLDYKIIDMSKYGAPQKRKRLLFLAVKKTIKNYELFKINESINSKYINVFDVIGNLPKINAGDKHKDDFMHWSSNLSELNLKRIRVSKEGGTWRDWPSELLPECYKKESGQTYSSVYGRISRNSLAPTLTTQFNRYGTGRYGHYEQDRGLSLREGAILQTFPENYLFDSSLGSTVLARQIGNAVPPIYAKILGKMIMKNIK